MPMLMQTVLRGEKLTPTAKATAVPAMTATNRTVRNARDAAPSTCDRRSVARPSGRGEPRPSHAPSKQIGRLQSTLQFPEHRGPRGRNDVPDHHRGACSVYAGAGGWP